MNLPCAPLAARRLRLPTLLLAGWWLLPLLAPSPSVHGCPFCSAVAQTFAEEINSLEAVIVARMVEPPHKPDDPDEAYAELPLATFEVVEVLKGDQWVKPGDQVQTSYYGKQFDAPFLIMGTDSPQIVWSSPLPMSDRGISYVRTVVQMPPGAERLKFFLNYLEDEDEMLARDAYDEFAKAPYDDILKLHDVLDREKIVGWITDTEKVPSSRRSLYITMLGVCGEPQDVQLLESLMRSDIREQKVGLNAMIACYLTLRGEEGMETIRELFLANPAAEYADTYAAITALRFHGAETEVLSRETVLEGFRQLLDRPDLADLVIPDLARYEDWTVLPRLVQLFENADEETNWVRVPIVNYVRACPLPKAAAIMEQLTQIDPEAVKRASMFMPFAPAKPTSPADATSGTSADATGGNAEAVVESEALPPVPTPPPDEFTAEDSAGVDGLVAVPDAVAATRRATSDKMARWQLPLAGIAALTILTLAIIGGMFFVRSRPAGA